MKICGQIFKQTRKLSDVNTSYKQLKSVLIENMFYLKIYIDTQVQVPLFMPVGKFVLQWVHT